MKEYEITGQLVPDKLCNDPIIIARYNGLSEKEAITKFRKGFPGIPVIGWIVSKFIY